MNADHPLRVQEKRWAGVRESTVLLKGSDLQFIWGVFVDLYDCLENHTKRIDELRVDLNEVLEDNVVEFGKDVGE